jgi:DNA (cytosine-5)-methyltransferase 1
MEAFNPFEKYPNWSSSCVWLSQKYTNTHVDFFCGAGGLSIGFERAGFKTVLATDWNEPAIETFNYNRPNSKPIGKVSDIKDLFQDSESFGEIDVVTGGPPCQSFSTANRQRIIDDPRNNLYKEFVRCCNKIRPKAVVMENVIGIRKVSDQIIQDFKDIGYTGNLHFINAKDFGLPQNRRRAFFVFLKKEIYPDCEDRLFNFEINIDGRKNISKEFKLRDALDGLRPLTPNNQKNNTKIENEQSGYTYDTPCCDGNTDYLRIINGESDLARRYIFNHKARYNNPRDIEIFSRLPQGCDSLHKSIADIMPYKNRNNMFKDKYYKLKDDDVCKTICAHMKLDCNMYIHPNQARGLTPREAARIQSFPDNYIFRGTPGEWYRQIGNAVPPVLAYHIASAVKECI